MSSKSIVAFGENGAFFSVRPNGGYFYSKIPRGIRKIVDGAKGHTYFWVSMGPDGQYYAAWKRKDGKETFELGIDDGVYDDLCTKLDNLSGSLEKVRVIFGPKKGSWFVITARGGYSSRNIGAHKGLSKDIDGADSGISHVALGRDGAWIVAYKDGSVSSDLMDNYGSLERLLDDMSDGDLKGVFLNPFSASQYVVGYKNGGQRSNMPPKFSEHVSF